MLKGWAIGMLERYGRNKANMMILLKLKRDAQRRAELYYLSTPVELCDS